MDLYDYFIIFKFIIVYLISNNNNVVSFKLGISYNDELVDSLHMTFKENAMFLLDLASTSGGRLTGDEPPSTSGPWTVGEFKCLSSLEVPATCKQLLQPDICNDALLHCDSVGVRIYSSQTFGQQEFCFYF